MRWPICTCALLDEACAYEMDEVTRLFSIRTTTTFPQSPHDRGIFAIFFYPTKRRENRSPAWRGITPEMARGVETHAHQDLIAVAKKISS